MNEQHRHLSQAPGERLLWLLLTVALGHSKRDSKIWPLMTLPNPLLSPAGVSLMTLIQQSFQLTQA